MIFNQFGKIFDLSRVLTKFVGMQGEDALQIDLCNCAISAKNLSSSTSVRLNGIELAVKPVTARLESGRRVSTI
jgi:hypothetical protein